MKHRLILVLSCLACTSALLVARGPERHTSAQTRGDNEKSKVEVCTLLTSAEIQSIQGEKLEEARPGAQSSNGLLMSQCLFRTATPVLSVSLALAGSARDKPRDFWRRQFHAGKATKKPVAERESKEGAGRPRSIAGLGEEAYWVGGPISGALYVLRGTTFLRISVGGERSESARIKKSVLLAQIALKRL